MGLMGTSLVLGHETVEPCPQWVTWPIYSCELEQGAPLWTSMGLLSTLSPRNPSGLPPSQYGLRTLRYVGSPSSSVCPGSRYLLLLLWKTGLPYRRPCIVPLIRPLDLHLLLVVSFYLSLGLRPRSEWPLSIEGRSAGPLSERRGRFGFPLPFLAPCMVLNRQIRSQ